MSESNASNEEEQKGEALEIKEGKKKEPELAHMFHSECIDNWFKKKAECPLCRACYVQRIKRYHRSIADPD